MHDTAWAAPDYPPTVRSYDPLAVALGNASLLNVGYLILGRRRLALLTGLVTAVLLVLLGSAVRTVGFEIVVAVWWVALVTHGWFTAGGRRQWTAAGGRRQWTAVGGRRPWVAVRRQRVVALAVTVPVLLIAGLLRFDASAVEHRVDAARAKGDCGRVVSAQRGAWFGPRLADAPLTTRGDRSVAACRRLETAREQLDRGLTGDTVALKAGFGTLAAVLAEPGNDQVVDTVLNDFLDGLPVKDPCRTVTVTDWLRGRTPSHDALDRSAGTVARTAPAALEGCADHLMTDSNWQAARDRYQQLIDQYPGDPRTPQARTGVHHATLSIELAHVRSLLDGPTDIQPDYCDTPAKYEGAPAFRKGRVNRAMFYGNDTYGSKLPGSWRTTDPAHAVLVVCADTEDYGTTVETCPYENKTFPDFPDEVKFHKIAIPVKVYELRTGKLLTKRKVQISGASCPQVLHYTYYYTDFGPGDDQYVKASKDDVRAAFRPVLTG